MDKGDFEFGSHFFWGGGGRWQKRSSVSEALAEEEGQLTAFSASLS